MKRILKILTIVCIVFIIVQCEKDDFITDNSAKLEFSIDTLFFDTVFTTIGRKYTSPEVITLFSG